MTSPITIRCPDNLRQRLEERAAESQVSLATLILVDLAKTSRVKIVLRKKGRPKKKA